MGKRGDRCPHDHVTLRQECVGYAVKVVRGGQVIREREELEPQKVWAVRVSCHLCSFEKRYTLGRRLPNWLRRRLAEAGIDIPE